MYKELLFVKDANEYVIKDKHNYRLEYVIFDKKLSVKVLLEKLMINTSESIHFKIINKTRKKSDCQVYEKVKLLLEYLEDAINQCVLQKKQVLIA